MKVSIIVPIYNVENYLKKCLDSLVNQTYKNIEIVCVNDGSTDNSLNIVEEYKCNYPEIIKIVNKKNGGLADARNFGIDNCSGEYIGFVDSDDWVDLKMYENMLNLALDSEADVVVCDYTEVYSDEEVLIKDDSMNTKILYESLVCNKLFKRELFEKVKIRFPLGLWYEDNATTYKLLFLANKVIKDDNYYYFYRRTRVGSIMNSQNNKKIYDMHEIGKNLYEFFSKYELTKEEEAAIEYIFIKNILFRQIPKIVKYEFPNIINMKKQLKKHYEVLENYFPNWYSNPVLLMDENGYFRRKIGSNHVYKLKKFKTSLSILLLSVIFKNN